MNDPKSFFDTCFSGHFILKVVSIDNEPVWEQEALNIKETEDIVLSLENLKVMKRTWEGLESNLQIDTLI